MRDIQNSQCLLNVEYSGVTCPHVTIQFGDTKEDVGLGLVKEGLVMVDVRKEKHLQKMVSEDSGTISAGGGWLCEMLCCCCCCSRCIKVPACVAPPALPPLAPSALSFMFWPTSAHVSSELYRFFPEWKLVLEQIPAGPVMWTLSPRSSTHGCTV